MNRTTIRAALAMLAALAAACSDATAGADGAAAQAARPATSPPAGTAAEGPCALLTTAEVQRAFAGAKPAKLDRSLVSSGILRCAWEYPGGRFGIIDGTEEADPVRTEAQTWTLGFIDPLNRDASRHVRYERLTGVGDEAIAVVERADPAKGFVANGAFLVVRRGARQITMMDAALAARDRPAALAALQELGKAAAKRME
jgi:hypothetical protein